MTLIQKTRDFILFGNWFVSLCAATMVVQTYILTGTPLSIPYVVFVFCSTLFLYNFQRVTLSPLYIKTTEHSRHEWILNNRNTISYIYKIALIIALASAYFISRKLLFTSAILGIISILYFIPGIQLRKLPGVKALVVAIVWAIVSVYVPTMSERFLIDNSTTSYMLVERTLFILSLCIVFNIRDIAHDRLSGVQTLPTLAGVKISKAVAVVSLLVSGIFSVIIYWQGAYTGKSLAAMLTSLTITILLVLKCSEKSSEYYYLFGIDGMMLLQTLLIYFSYFL